eukprot:scaffold3342_cov186-Alexandrium_tamarense.AAC.5
MVSIEPRRFVHGRLLVTKRFTHSIAPESQRTRHETRCPARLVAPTVYGKTDSLIKATNPGREHASSPAAAVLLTLHSVHRSVASIVDTLLSPPHQYFSTST